MDKFEQIVIDVEGYEDNERAFVEFVSGEVLLHERGISFRIRRDDFTTVLRVCQSVNRWLRVVNGWRGVVYTFAAFVAATIVGSIALVVCTPVDPSPALFMTLAPLCSLPFVAASIGSEMRRRYPLAAMFRASRDARFSELASLADAIDAWNTQVSWLNSVVLTVQAGMIPNASVESMLLEARERYALIQRRVAFAQGLVMSCGSLGDCEARIPFDPNSIARFLVAAPGHYPFEGQDFAPDGSLQRLGFLSHVPAGCWCVIKNPGARSVGEWLSGCREVRNAKAIYYSPLMRRVLAKAIYVRDGLILLGVPAFFFFALVKGGASVAWYNTAWIFAVVAFIPWLLMIFGWGGMRERLRKRANEIDSFEKQQIDKLAMDARIPSFARLADDLDAWNRDVSLHRAIYELMLAELVPEHTAWRYLSLARYRRISLIDRVHRAEAWAKLGGPLGTCVMPEEASQHVKSDVIDATDVRGALSESTKQSES